ncbi:MAG TPA: type VI secretion system-associated protein TagF [Methylocella sp.]|nr:type VI secretion system-associated protein TagF [Methylocella sp.]
MRCGIFGKLPCKRDFVAINAPQRFLSVWEPWLQAGVSASRAELRDKWQAAFLTAPIWRFWLGSEICGTTILGAFMPSVDEIGRYFPLVLFASAAQGLAVPPPEFEPHTPWFAAGEDFLLSTLCPSVTFDQICRALDHLALPVAYSPIGAPNVIRTLTGGVVAPIDDSSPSKIFAALRHSDWAAAEASRSFWWTIGGAEFRPVALATRHMPGPALFSGMLTGNLLAE